MMDLTFTAFNFKGRAELIFNKLEGYDDFEIIEELLINNFNARSIARWIGPESKIWEFEINGIALKLHNNPYGNSIYADTEKERILLADLFYQLRIME